MRRRHWLVAAGAAALGPVAAQPAAGRVERLPALASKWVVPRPVDVWLPPGYTPDKRYPVLYMHDGQMLFDARSTWNGQAWHADAAVLAQHAAGRLPEMLIVGVWNLPEQRYAEYFPQAALAHVPEPLRSEYVERGQNGKPQGEAYLRFLVDEVKPAVDARYATAPGPGATFVAGSSMGGLASLAALCEHPQVFGGAVALSAHWVRLPTAWGLQRLAQDTVPAALLVWLAARLPRAGSHRLWVDRGTDALDGLYAPALTRFEALLRERGHGPDAAAVRVFEGTGHTERDWAARFGSALAFVAGPAVRR